MDFLKHFNDDAREPVMEDPGGIRACVQELQKRQVEFKLKVDKAQTVPYTVLVERLDKEACILAFQRPLPPELLKGALFVGNFQMEGHNFQARFRYHERTAYLRYQFAYPEQVSKMERRRVARLPFRPREKAFVTLRDGGIPGLGASGPLLNISAQGLAMRVDRVIRLDTGMRLGIHGGHFPPDKFFSAVRLEELPGLPVLDLRGFAVHATEKGGILMLGLSFQEPTADVARQLDDMLKLRVKLQAAKSPLVVPEGGGAGARKAGEARPAAMEAPASWDAPEVLNEAPPDESETTQELDPLRLLQRRCMPISVALGEGSEPLATWLRTKGYRRLSFGARDTAPANALILTTEAPEDPGTLQIPGEDAWDKELLPLLDQRAVERV